MKVLLAVLLVATLASAQQTHEAPVSHSQTRVSETQAQSADMNSAWQAELPNMKSDLAELRSLLNVMGSQEFNLDPRTRDALETNRRMWQVVIGRLSELTERMDALERSQGHQLPRPHPEQP